MKVKLISYSQPTREFGEEFNQYPDLQDLVCYCARVSNPSNQLNQETNEKLVSYLVRNKHWSPLEMVTACLEIETTRDIARQILRHRSFSFQEFCVDEDTLITTLAKSGGSKKVKIKDLFKRQSNSQYWNMSDNLVRVYDEKTKTLVSAKIKEVFETGVKPCYEIILDNGKKITCTEDHKIMTFEGFKRVKDISIEEDFVACNGIPLYQDKEWLQSAKEFSIKNGTGLKGIAELANISTHTISKWLKKHEISFTKKEVAQYTIAWNSGLPSTCQPRYGLKTSIETKIKQSESAKLRGRDHNFYVHGNCTLDNNTWRKRVAGECFKWKSVILEKQNYKCALSGVDIDMDNSDIDHILPVSLRPDLAFDSNNLQVLSKQSHKEKTILENRECKYTATFHKISLIKFVGDKQTYDIEVEHDSHNYIANGIITHNSQRYANILDLEEQFVIREARLQDQKNRQNSVEVEDSDLQEEWAGMQRAVIESASRAYQWAIEHGIAKEQARVVLPEGNTISRMYMTGSIRSWIHYIDLRSANGTQKEHQLVAIECAKAISRIFPIDNYNY